MSRKALKSERVIESESAELSDLSVAAPAIIVATELVRLDDFDVEEQRLRERYLSDLAALRQKRWQASFQHLRRSRQSSPLQRHRYWPMSVASNIP